MSALSPGPVPCCVPKPRAARALLFYSLNPLWSAVLGRVFLMDKLPRHTLIALGAAVLCMGIIFIPPALLGQSSTESRATWHGDMAGVIIGLLFAVNVAFARYLSKRCGACQ